MILVDNLLSNQSVNSYFVSFQIAEKLNLLHVSEGQEEKRHIIVRKPAHSGAESSGGARPKSSKKKSGKKSPSAQNNARSQAQNGVKEKVLMEDDDSDSDDGESSEEEVESNVANCPICKKIVPKANFELHKLRCKPEPEPAPQQGKSKKKKNKKTKNAIEKQSEEDFDALIAAAQKENSVCNYPKCKQYTTTLGQNCEFCAKRFCLSHHIPEGHGCGDRAKQKARMLISREGVLYRGSGVPDKKTDPAKRAHLERKLEKKMGDMEESRKPKKKNKNDK